MRDSQRTKVYTVERAALEHVTADHIGPHLEEYRITVTRRAPNGTTSSVRRLTDDAWARYRKAAVAALTAEARPLLTSEWWRTVTGWDHPRAPRAQATALRIAPKNAHRASRGGIYTNGPAISLLHSMTTRRTLYHELAHVAVYGAQRTPTTRDAYQAAGGRITEEPGHGRYWRGLYVAVLEAAGYPNDAAALADAWTANRLPYHPCPIAPPTSSRGEPAPRRLIAADPIHTAEPLTLF